MLTASYSHNALASRVAAIVYLLVAVGAATFVRHYSERNAGSTAIVLAFGVAALILAVIMFDRSVAAQHQYVVEVDNASAAKQAQQRAADFAAHQRQVARSTAYYRFVGAGLSEELAAHLVEHDIYTVEAALDIELEYRARHLSYNDELAQLVVRTVRDQVQAMPYNGADGMGALLNSEWDTLTHMQQEMVLCYEAEADYEFDNSPDYDALYEQLGERCEPIAADAEDANYQDWPFQVFVNPEHALQPVGVMPITLAPLAVESEWPDEQYWQQRHEDFLAKKQPATVTGVLEDQLPWLNN